MFKKRIFRWRNKPGNSQFLENSEKHQQSFIAPIQTKLNVNSPGDSFEKEADNMADKVIGPENNHANIQKMEAEEEEVQAKPLAGEITPLIQKQSMPEEEEEPVQAKEEKEEEVQMKANGRPEMHHDLTQKLKDKKGSGGKMAPEVQAEFENAFGVDFSEVNIHTDSSAHQLNKDLNAKAFTHGKDIYFRQGNYQPDSKEGKHLLAHELTHTVQQGAVNATRSKQNRVGNKSIQRKEISYRNLKWTDFKASAPENTDYDAYTYSGINYINNKVINPNWNWNGEVVTVAITYKPSNADLKPFMETDLSWKKDWLTDDAAAEKKFGPDANIKKERKSLLGHEQIHFKITKSIAEKYRTELRKAIPSKTYKVTAEADTEASASAFFDEILKKKNSELEAILKPIVEKANNEKGLIQEIYDTDTDHSGIKAKQGDWEKQFDKTFKEAVARAKKQQNN
ncbi:DUF4157 domain-containing protein [Christiangramia crocea]|uniref:DUF4157 domain-containing protein n=1 Tax=Christiangramia crocea TaxID=2904124 RepID=A0A9X1UYP7_9FLAO|nr:DUF4157 domain-containing protein [Gramella crocea]MCG9972580.1 DUF4157 domain-containing protein [Gramella crocea]